jgi:hypothetical protein
MKVHAIVKAVPRKRDPSAESGTSGKTYFFFTNRYT